MKHRSQRHRRWKRCLKNFGGCSGLYKGAEYWWGNWNKWFKINNKGKKVVELIDDILS